MTQADERLSDVDVEDVVAGLKTVQREVRRAVAAVDELNKRKWCGCCCCCARNNG